MAYAADRSQLLSKTQDVFASQSEGSILGLCLTSPAQPETEQGPLSFSEIFSYFESKHYDIVDIV